MEIIRGKHASFMDTAGFAEQLAGYSTVHIDIGTGDGRFVQHVAQANPNTFVIGIDACRENLVEVSRRTSDNALFVIANAYTLPYELMGLAAKITINFPWGSLLEGLLANDLPLLESLLMVARPQAEVEVRLNAGAVAEAGWLLEEGANQIRGILAENGFKVKSPVALTAADLKVFPTTWAKRLAFGRDPRAMYLTGVKKCEGIVQLT
jgi:16S rRNA (adenine(1408)-N(1))-methyltransferase